MTEEPHAESNRFLPRTAITDVRRALLACAAVLVSVLLAVLVVEGAHALLRWNRLDGSIVYSAWRAAKDAARGPRPDAADPAYARTLSRNALDALVPGLRALDAGLGNSPYEELVSDAAAVNERVDGCLVQKPNLRKRMTFLRTNAFNPLDPPALFFDATRTPPPAVAAAIREYGVRLVTHSTNAAGERITLPTVDAGRVVLVAGDSVANGAMVDDAETLASRLQANDATRRYVNIGVGNADASDVLCNVERALERYAGRVDALVYVFCANDFELPAGAPERVLTRLGTLARNAGVARTAVVYAPFVYNIVPQHTRFRGYRGARWPTFAHERAQLAAGAAAAGFRYLDVADVALAEAEKRGTPLAALALFVDHVHLSPYGTRLVAEALADDLSPR